MSLLVTIALDGPPRGKGRPRSRVTNKGFAQVYTDEKTVKYESQLRYAAMQEMAGEVPTDLPVCLTMTVRFAVPTTWSRKKTAAALLGHVRPTVKPDADNTLKLTDALNGIVWLDDKQVVEARVRKFYAEIPGLTIAVKTISAPEQQLTLSTFPKNKRPTNASRRPQGETLDDPELTGISAHRVRESQPELRRVMRQRARRG